MTPQTKRPGGEVWRVEVGHAPIVVIVEEVRSKDGTLYLRWWDAGLGNWRRKSLQRVLRTPRGAVQQAVARWAEEEAEKLRRQLVAAAAASGVVGWVGPEDQVVGLTVADLPMLLTDPDTGRYPTDTHHRREVLRACQVAAQVWGGHTPLEAITKSDWVRLWRWRIRDLKKAEQLAAKAAAGEGKRGRVRHGFRGAEITVLRLQTAVQALRDQERIPAGAAAWPPKWRDDFKKDWHELTGSVEPPQEDRPRYTADEVARLFANLHRADPRVALGLMLGAELRPGQVVRAWRRHLDLDADEPTFTVHGMGKKRGEVVFLTPGQVAYARAALATGYLRDLEADWQAAGVDYPLFPAGQMKGSRSGLVEGANKHARAATPWLGVATRRNRTEGCASSRTFQGWFRELEDLAEVKHIDGRLTYGVRRAQVDRAAESDASDDVIQRLGGWTDARMPKTVYRDQQTVHERRKARDLRARIRGEAPAAEPAP